MTLNMFEKFPLGYQVLTLMKDFEPDSEGSLALNKLRDDIYSPFYNGSKPVDCIKFGDMLSDDNPFIDNPQFGAFYSNRDWRSIFKHFGFKPNDVENILCVNHEINENSRTVLRSGNDNTTISEVLLLARSTEIQGKKGLLVSCHYTGFESSPTNMGIYIGGAVFLTAEQGDFKLFEVNNLAKLEDEITHPHIMDLFIFAIAVGMYYSTSEYTSDMQAGRYSFKDYEACGDRYMENARNKNNHALAQCYIGYLLSELRDPTPIDSQGYSQFHTNVANTFLKDNVVHAGIIALADAKKTVLHVESTEFDNELKEFIGQLSWSKVAKKLDFEPKIHQPVLFLEGNYFQGVTLPNTPDVFTSTIGAILKSHTINGVNGILGVGGIMGVRFGEPVLSFDENYFFISKDQGDVVVEISSDMDFSEKIRLSGSAFGVKVNQKTLLMVISQIIPSLHLFNTDQIEHFQCVMTKSFELDSSET